MCFTRWSVQASPSLMPCAMAASNRSCGWRDSLDSCDCRLLVSAVLLLLIVRSPVALVLVALVLVALVLVALVSTSVASTSSEALPTSVFPVLPSASLANALLTVELLTAIPLAAASVLSAEVQVVALPASVLGVCDEVLSSLGYYSVFPGDSSRFRAIESRSESPPEMPIYSVRYPSFPDFPYSCCSR